MIIFDIISGSIYACLVWFVSKGKQGAKYAAAVSEGNSAQKAVTSAKAVPENPLVQDEAAKAPGLFQREFFRHRLPAAKDQLTVAVPDLIVYSTNRVKAG